MIAGVRLENGRANYRNHFIRTDCLMAEQEAGGPLWGGLADPPGMLPRPGFGAHGGLKVSASTDVVVHADIADSPICRIALPHKIPSGTHACWAGAEEIG